MMHTEPYKCVWGGQHPEMVVVVICLNQLSKGCLFMGDSDMSLCAHMKALEPVCTRGFWRVVPTCLLGSLKRLRPVEPTLLSAPQHPGVLLWGKDTH